MPRLKVTMKYYGRCFPRRGTPRPYTRPVKGRPGTARQCGDKCRDVACHV
ncbi:MAG: hypothetical protein HDS84_06130 [Bacteroidales bacterium]|nr:hypothetical protein [Bacteroidales bacterium]MBD5302009.1 hypothetical protein [Bacteroides sp.]